MITQVQLDFLKMIKGNQCRADTYECNVCILYKYCEIIWLQGKDDEVKRRILKDIIDGKRIDDDYLKSILTTLLISEEEFFKSS